jgi:hypothetical protein
MEKANIFEIYAFCKPKKGWNYYYIIIVIINVSNKTVILDGGGGVSVV